MKQLIIFFTLLSMSTDIIGQQINPLPSLTKEDFLKKSKRQKTSAWILLGAGSLAVISGSIEVNPDYGESTNRAFLVIGGLVFMGAGIASFIASGRNKKKAASLSFSNQFVPQVTLGGLVHRPVRSLHFKISL